MKTIWLALAFVIGAGSMIVAGGALLAGTRHVAEGTPQRVDVDAKADALQRFDDAFAEMRSLDSEAYHNAKAALAMAPLIFAQPSGAAAPLTPDVDVSDARADTAASGQDEKADWRNANASAGAADVDKAADVEKDVASERPIEKHRSVKTADKPARARKPAARTAQQTPDNAQPACVQPTGLNGFLASLSLKPHCEIGAVNAKPAG